MIHPIVDCEHPLLCLLGLVSQGTAISPSLQQRLASVCNGVIMESVHTLVFVLLQFHVFCKLYLIFKLDIFFIYI